MDFEVTECKIACKIRAEGIILAELAKGSKTLCMLRLALSNNACYAGSKEEMQSFLERMQDEGKLELFNRHCRGAGTPKLHARLAERRE